MTKGNKESIGKWIEKAEQDIIAAQTLFDIRPFILDVVCFHCQQAVEKLLKAFLFSKGQEIEKTHDIVFLQEQCSNIDMDFSDIDFKNLNTYAVDARYPDFISPELNEVKEYLLIAGKIKKLVLNKVS